MSEIQSFWWESQAAACEDIILSVDGLSALENDHNNQIIEIYSACQKKREEIKQENDDWESLYSNDEIQKPKDDSPEPKPKNYSPQMYADTWETNRSKINDWSHLTQLYDSVDAKRISLADFKQKLNISYIHAFRSEIQSQLWQKGVENINKHASSWKEIFWNILEPIIGDREKAENLFLLSWVEWSGFNHEVNAHGAIGYFQIRLANAKEIQEDITQADLKDPIKSAEISALHLKWSLESILKSAPGISIDNAIEMALLQYNGNFSRRLNEKYRWNIEKTIFYLYKDLNWIKVCAGHKPWFETIADIQQKLQQVHKKYYASWKNGTTGIHKDPYSTDTHFRVLDEINSGKLVKIQEVPILISKYIEQVMMQQLMYPRQFHAIKHIYEQTS